MVMMDGTLIKGKSVTRKIEGKTVKVGTMSRSGKFFMEKDQQKGHLKYKDDAFGMNEDVFQKIKDRADKIIVVFKDNMRQEYLYKAEPETWEEHGEVKKDGAETQRFLSRKHMEKNKLAEA